MMVLLKSDSIHTREVWNHNLDNEFDLIKKIVDDFPYIAIVIKSPGVVLLPLGNFKTISDSHYQTLKANVDMLKPIQLGLTFFDKAVNLPTCGTDKYCIWQFNFREFSFTQDIYATDSIEMMRQSKINFEMNNKMGVDANSFAEVLMSSGIVLNEDVCFVTFHGGYDFGYLLKLLTGKNLPDTKTEFFNLIKIFFPEFYDTKYLMKFCGGFHGGLDKLAELLGVERIGICHQAGSDSLLTSGIFKKMKETFFHGLTEKHGGVLYGFGAEN